MFWLRSPTIDCFSPAEQALMFLPGAVQRPEQIPAMIYHRRRFVTALAQDLPLI